MSKELTRIIMKHTCSDETKTKEAESLTPQQDAQEDINPFYRAYIMSFTKELT